MEQQDTPHDALVHLLQLLPLADRVRLSALSTAWLRAAAETFKDVEAKVDDNKAPAFRAWLKRHGRQVEALSVRSCEPSSIPSNMTLERFPVDEASVDLPCASLPKLHTLRLYNIDPTFEGVTDATTHNPLPSLTSLKAYESQYINPYLHMLTSLQQLSLSDMDYPTGNLMKMATALTQLTRLHLEWTGDAAWESKAYTHPYGFSRNGRYYEPGSMSFDEDAYKQAFDAAFTEDVTFLFAGLPALQELEMGCYTDMRGDDALSRKLHCSPVVTAAEHLQAHGTAAAGAAHRGRGRGRGHGRAAAAADAPRQRLTALKVCNALDMEGIENMLIPNLTTLTRLELSVADMHSLDGDEASMLFLFMPALKQQLVHLDIGRGVVTYGAPAEVYTSFAGLTALTCLKLDSDAGPAGAMSALFEGGPGSMSRLRVFHCRLNTGYNQLGGDDPVQGMLDLRAMAAACPNLQELSFAYQCDGVFAQGVASPAEECRALRALTCLTSLALRTDGGWLDSFFDDFATLTQLRELTLADGTRSRALYGDRGEPPAVTWQRLRKLTALTNLQQLEAEPLIKVSPKLPWKYPATADAPAGPTDGAPNADADAEAESQPQPVLPPGVALHQLLSEVAGSEALQRHAAHLISSHRSPMWVKSEDPGW